ncbi:AAA family ATPase [Candidatus Parabeggiatoa sp. HSG14]|uniref:AAA family ATPase n=1 Tax=Candidatus Parabeggiatoa sp. HSG14 TaxID=3055593 RepID=UPI0025A6B6BD|nr:AAA family ATPase [Thiotrichales bacterium HSG14]
MLKEIKLSGFKSIRETKVALKKINVLIGANGAGKSNFINFFRLLVSLTNNRLQFYIRRNGGANALLHYGIKTTKQMTAHLCLDIEEKTGVYAFTLSLAPVNTLIIEEHANSTSTALGKVGEESLFFDKMQQLDTPTDNAIRNEISRYSVFHFHDTSETTYMRGNCDINNNRILQSDGSNLAAVLYKLQKIQKPYYERIVKTIRQIAPFFKDFILEPLTISPHEIQLRWQARDSDYEFGPHQLSDGTLRTMALITLLLQPEEDLPSLIILDEPELGLHPYAISLIAALIRSVSIYTQVILATQSINLLDHFEVEDIIIVEQQQGISLFKRLEPDKLTTWLEAYALSELWEKNVLGGSPSR